MAAAVASHSSAAVQKAAKFGSLFCMYVEIENFSGHLK
jgi:hypothetical protein